MWEGEGKLLRVWAEVATFMAFLFMVRSKRPGSQVVSCNSWLGTFFLNGGGCGILWP